MRRKLHVPALIGFVATVAVTAKILWARWTIHADSHAIMPSAMGPGWTSVFGTEAFLILAAAAPLAAWLGHKAFFSRFARRRRRRTPPREPR